MTIDEFSAITRKVIDRDGFTGFLPIACYPARKVIRALAEVPAGADMEAVALEWAIDKSEPDEEVLVAYRIDSRHFKIVRRLGAEAEHATFAVDQG